MFILHILLILLKIVGILLLILLGLILLLLVVPIRYQFRIVTPDVYEACVRWFYPLIRFQAAYQEGDIQYKLNILWFTLLSSEEKGENGEKDLAEKVTEETETAPAEEATEETEPEPAEEVTEETETAPAPTDLEEDSGESVAGNDTKEHGDHSKAEKSSMKDRMSSLRKTIESGLSFMEEYQIRQLIHLARVYLIKILKHILPKKLVGHVHYGMDNPEYTGQITGVAAMLYPLYHNQFEIYPDFYEECFEADCKGKGRIRLGFFAIIIVQLLRKREVRKIIGWVLRR